MVDYRKIFYETININYIILPSHNTVQLLVLLKRYTRVYVNVTIPSFQTGQIGRQLKNDGTFKISLTTTRYISLPHPQTKQHKENTG